MKPRNFHTPGKLPALNDSPFFDQDALHTGGACHGSDTGRIPTPRRAERDARGCAFPIEDL